MSVVNKFDTQRIRKAIRDRKINDLLSTEKVSPELLKTISVKKRSLTNEPKTKEQEAIENLKIENARKRKREYLSRDIYNYTTDLVKTETRNLSKPSFPTSTLDNRRQTFEEKIDPLSPLEMKAIREQILMDSSSTGEVLLRNPKHHFNYESNSSIRQPSDSLSYLSRVQLSNTSRLRKLSPRLEEFCKYQKDQISRIYKDSESKISEIVEYPDQKARRLTEKSFENIRPVDDRSDPMKLVENSSTFHFKVSLNNNDVGLKKQIHEVSDEFGIDPVDK